MSIGAVKTAEVDFNELANNANDVLVTVWLSVGLFDSASIQFAWVSVKRQFTDSATSARSTM